MATTKYVYPDGEEVPKDHCVMPDNYQTTIQITVRSMRPLTGECLKEIVQTKHEVLGQPQVVKSLAVVKRR
jgi:hypothetical protein